MTISSLKNLIGREGSELKYFSIFLLFSWRGRGSPDLTRLEITKITNNTHYNLYNYLRTKKTNNKKNTHLISVYRL